MQYTNTYDRIPEAEIIANQVLSYKGNAPEGYMFFDAKVEEVMSLVFGKYLQYQKTDSRYTNRTSMQLRLQENI